MSQRESMRQQLEVSHGGMVAALEGLSEDEMTRVPAAGLAPVIWQVGHIALVDAMLGQFAGGRFAPPKEFLRVVQYGHRRACALPRVRRGQRGF